MKKPPVVLTIGGHDPCSGAGISLDLKTMEYVGCYGVAVCTTVTAQNTQGIIASYPLPKEILAAQLQAIFADFFVQSVKIGLLTSPDHIQTLAQFFRTKTGIPIILDPIIRSSSGYLFLDNNLIQRLKTELLPVVSLLTPNIPEFQQLYDLHWQGPLVDTELLMIVEKIKGANILIKGGHQEFDPIDLLIWNDKVYSFAAKRVSAQKMHGTGCALTSAMASFLALGYGWVDAVRFSKQLVTRMIEKSLPLGKGLNLCFLGRLAEEKLSLDKSVTVEEQTSFRFDRGAPHGT